MERTNMNMETTYEAYKPLLMSIAYRMLGSVMDAEDVVHDVFMEWEKVRAGGDRDGRPIEQVKSYLCRMVTNRAIDQLRSAKRKRERYVGVWLPEPVVSDPEGLREAEQGDPLQRLVLRDSLSMAYLLMLEALSPTERAVFLLREIYAYEFEELAAMLGKRADHCRQILSRARRKLRTADRQGIVPPVRQVRSAAAVLSTREREAAHDQVLARFTRYVTDGNIEGVLGLLTDDAVFVSDGGGKVQAAIHPICGSDRVSRFVLGIAAKQQAAGLAVRPVRVNGEPGIVLLSGGGMPYCTMAFAYSEGRIAAIYSTLNPDKLQHLASRVR